MSTKDTHATSRPGFEWLYPDLLSMEQLITTLEQRYIKDVDLQKLNKEELVELYNKYIIPLPQRKYRKNRRGRDMTIKQIKMAKKRRAVTSADDNQPLEKRKSTGKLMSSFDLPPTVGDRLKPPPSCIDGNRKKIKLGTSVNSNSETLSPVASSLKRLKLIKSDQADTVSPKKVRLKNDKEQTTEEASKDSTANNNEIKGDNPEKDVDHVVNSGAKDPMDTTESAKGEEVTAKKKIKIKRIAWP